MQRNDLNNKADICVSIILPVFNREKTIESAILSVLEQTYTKFELIVVDDGSSDNSVSLAQQMASQDDRIKVITHPKNSGRPSVARNTGVQHARYDWLAFLDSDDEWTKNKLELQLAFVAELPEVNAVFADCHVKKYAHKQYMLSFFASTGISKALDEIELNHSEHGRTFNAAALEGLLCKTGFIMTQGVLVKRALFIKAGMFNPELTYSEDTDLWLKLASMATYGQSYGQLFSYIQREDSISVNIQSRYYADRLSVLKNHIALQTSKQNTRLLKRRLAATAMDINFRTGGATKCLQDWDTLKILLSDPIAARNALKVSIKNYLKSF